MEDVLQEEMDKIAAQVRGCLLLRACLCLLVFACTAWAGARGPAQEPCYRAFRRALRSRPTSPHITRRHFVCRWAPQTMSSARCRAAWTRLWPPRWCTRYGAHPCMQGAPWPCRGSRGLPGDRAAAAAAGGASITLTRALPLSPSHPHPTAPDACLLRCAPAGAGRPPALRVCGQRAAAVQGAARLQYSTCGARVCALFGWVGVRREHLEPRPGLRAEWSSGRALRVLVTPSLRSGMLGVLQEAARDEHLQPPLCPVPHTRNTRPPSLRASLVCARRRRSV